MAACLLRQDHVWIFTNQLDGCHNNEFNQMPFKMKSTMTENPRSFEK